MVQSLKLRLQKQEKESASLREQLEGLEANSRRHEADTAALVQAQDQIASLTSELTTQQQEQQGLQAKLAAAEGRDRESSSNQASWQLEESRLKSALQQAHASITDLNAAAAGNSSASKELQQQVQAAEEACDASRAAADAKQAEFAALETEVSQLKGSLEEARLQSKGNSSSQEELTSLRQNMSSFEEQVRFCSSAQGRHNIGQAWH